MKGFIVALTIVAFAAVASGEYEYDLEISLGDDFKEQQGYISNLKVSAGLTSFFHSEKTALTGKNGSLKPGDDILVHVDLKRPLEKASKIELTWQSAKPNAGPIQVEAITATSTKGNETEFCGETVSDSEYKNILSGRPTILKPCGPFEDSIWGYLFHKRQH